VLFSKRLNACSQASDVLPPFLPDQRRLHRLLQPIRSGVGADHAARGADHLLAKPWHGHVIGVVIGTDNRLGLAIWVDAVHGETTHAELAHVAERHRIAGWVLGFHFRNGTGYTSLLVIPSAVLANFSFASAKRV